MLDLSNLNAEPNWKRIHQAGQRRVYLKASEGVSFVDRRFRSRRLACISANQSRKPPAGRSLRK